MAKCMGETTFLQVMWHEMGDGIFDLHAWLNARTGGGGGQVMSLATTDSTGSMMFEKWDMEYQRLNEQHLRFWHFVKINDCTTTP